MRKLVCFFPLLLLAVFLDTEPACAQNGVQQAGISMLHSPVREFFARLPLTLFENTPEGMNDDERQELLEIGASAYWKIADESELSLTLESLPFGETVVFVRLFPQKSQGGGQGFVLGAIGTRSSDMCTIEMWREDKNGRMVPEDTPPESPITDFFSPKTLVPKDVEPSVLLCLGPQGLEAMPIFWNASGMAYIPVEATVHYEWTGNSFEKRIRPKRAP